MKHDPEIDTFICKKLDIAEPLTYDKLKEAASSRGLVLQYQMAVRGPRFVITHDRDLKHYYKTRTAAYREGLIRWILNSAVGSPSNGKSQ